MTEETTELRVEQRHWSRARDWWHNKKGFGGDHLRQLAEAFARFERDLTRPAAVDADGVERVAGDRTTPLGLYEVEWHNDDGGKSLASIYMDKSGDRWIAPTNWMRPGKLTFNPNDWSGVKHLAALTRPQAVDGPCTMGVGCDEAGVCYAEAHGEPERCPRHTAQSLADQPASDVAPEKGAVMGRAFFARLRCALFHHKAKVWTPVHHSWDFRCTKCGMEGTIDD